MSVQEDREQTALPAPNRTRRASDFILGLFVLIAALCYLGAWMWLKSEPFWHPAQHVNVYFHNVGGLNENAAVYSDGVRIGGVRKIELKGKHTVLVQLKINEENVRLPVGSGFTIRTNGLVGAKYVDVTLPDARENAQELTPNMVVWGTDPSRPELLVDKIATKLSNIDYERLEHNLNHGVERMSVAADHVSVLSRKLHPAADRAVVMEHKVTVLAAELHGTARKINKLLDDPMLARDARETLTRLNEMTAHVDSAITKVERMTENPELRNDIKQIIGDAKETVADVRAMINDPTFGNEMKMSLSKARSALARLDLVGQQMNQILDKRFPLLHLMLGRPGKIENEQTAGTNESVPE
jgi:ABC-type transporter Mla subunit MlaD